MTYRFDLIDEMTDSCPCMTAESAKSHQPTAKGDLTKRLKTHGAAIKKLLKKGIVEREAQIKLVRTTVWKIFGFAEACIIELPGKLIGVELYDVIQYAIEVISSDSDIPQMLDQPQRKAARTLKLRYYALTDGIRWSLYEVDIETGEKYRQIAELSVEAIDTVSDDLAEKVLNFSSERHQKEVTTDPSNRKRWYGYWNKNKTQAECLFLVEYVLYTDSSESVHIPLLDLTLWGNKPFEARSKAWEKIEAYASEHFKGKIGGSFETMAYKREKTSLKKKIKMTRGSSESAQGELFA